MIIQCDKCSTKFKLDESKVTGKGIKVRCTKCQNVFVVTPPEAAAAPPPPPPPAPEEGGFDIGVGGSEKKEETAVPPPGLTGSEPAAPAEGGKPGEAAQSFGEQDFDFGAPPEGGFGGPEQGGEGAPQDWSLGGGTGGGGTGGGGTGGGGTGDEDVQKFLGGPEQGFGEGTEPPAFGGPEAGGPPHEEEESFPPPPEPTPPQPPASDDWEIGKADEGEHHEEGKTEAERGMDEKSTPEVKKEDKGAAPPPPAPAHGGMTDKDFADALSKSIEDESKVPAAAKSAKPAGAGSKTGAIAAIIILCLIIIGGGVYYFTSSGAERKAVVQKTVDIDTINGYFSENPNIGKFFVIEARIKNLTGSPQPVKGVMGVIYDAKGAKLKTMRAQVISAEDIKKVTKEDMDKAAASGSAGTIPAKGTLPVAAIFIEMPQGMAEYGIEIAPLP